MVNSTGTRRTPLHPSAWALAALLTVLVTLLVPLLWDPRHYFYGDTQAAYYGWWYHLGQQVRTGSLPLLDPHAWAAGNLVAEGQWGTFSPLVIGIGLVATVSTHVLLLATVVKIALTLVGSLGIFVLARSYGVGNPAAYVAAVAVPMGGVTQFLDLPSWVAALMIWALLPWAWWGIRRTMLAGRGHGANPLPALVMCYLLVSVGYVYGTIMLIFVLVACLVDCLVHRDGAAALRVFLIAVFSGLVALTVYLPGVLTIAVTNRGARVGGFGGKYATDPLAMFASVLPTASVPGTSLHLLPYAYALWFLPVLLWLDFAKIRATWRPLAGLFFMTVVTLLVVDGPARLGPLRWPLRLQTFLVQMLVLLCVVLVSRYAVRRPSPRRLTASLAWVSLAGIVAVVRAPSLWGGHLLSVVVVAVGLTVVWVLLRAERRRVATLAGAVAAFTVGVFVLQQAWFPLPPSPDRNMPTRLADYQSTLPTAKGDVLVVGQQYPVLVDHAAAAEDLLEGSAWYLAPHPVHNTYTTIGFHAYTERYCLRYDGSTCTGLLDVLFTTEPRTGKKRVDLLGVSTLVMVRADYPAKRLSSPPPGWHVSDTSPYTVTWVRDEPVDGAGGPVWSSPGTRVTSLPSGDRTERFRVDRVSPGGGEVVLSRIPWPGYHVDGGRLGEAVDGYLMSISVSPAEAGQTVDVHFSPPGWPWEVASWWIAVLAGAAWSARARLRRR